MVLNLGITKDDRQTVDKTVEFISSINAIIKDDTTIINPTFILKYDTDIALDFNYIYCAEWHRYYFVTNITVMSGNRISVACHVDVLMSSKEELRLLEVVIDKQEATSLSNKYFNDNSFNVLSKESVDIINFNNGFNENGEFILICAGGGSNG